MLHFIENYPQHKNLESRHVCFDIFKEIESSSNPLGGPPGPDWAEVLKAKLNNSFQNVSYTQKLHLHYITVY